MSITDNKKYNRQISVFNYSADILSARDVSGTVPDMEDYRSNGSQFVHILCICTFVYSESGRGYMISFRQWYNRKCDISRSFKNIYGLELALLAGPRNREPSACE